MGHGMNQYDYESANMETKYYDMLYDFTGVITKANEQSFEGYTPKQIAKKLKKAAPAFFSLCMIDCVTDNNLHVKVEKEQQQETVQPEDQVEVEKPDNFLQIDSEGWGLCPVCHGKALRVTNTTRLENFPMYCKRCREEHLVNWWNADHQRILYKRYVNERRLRNNALKGTGLRSYQRSGTSATEREAIKA